MVSIVAGPPSSVASTADGQGGSGTVVHGATVIVVVDGTVVVAAEVVVVTVGRVRVVVV
jgi:hypothetical protein